MIQIEDFDKVELRVGTIVQASINKKARKPAYKVTIDFGENIGTKTSSAQITDLYIAPMHIGSVKSEVRIMGTESEQGVVLLTTMESVRNGDRIF